MQTFLEFKTRMRAEMWPSGEAASLRGAHNPFFNDAMMDMQRWIPCLRQFNVSTWEFGETSWENAKTVVNAPWGKIKRVYTIAGGLDRWRDKVRYRSSTYPIIECWANALFDAITPTSLPELALGFRSADASSDSPYGRARIGIWAVERKRLYIAPYIQSTEMLIVDWDGEKSKWLDSDGVDETYWTSDVEEAIKYYVLFKHELMWGDRAASKDFKALYDAKLADLIHKCREFTMQQHDHTCDGAAGGSELVGLSTDTTDDDDDPTTDPSEDGVLFVVAGDVGEDSTEAIALSDAIETNDDPDFLVLAGDLNYGSGYAVDMAHYDWAKDSGIIIPVLGNHDHDATIAAFQAFFATELAGKNNGRYYEHVGGPAHCFIIDTDAREADGINTSSIQHEWLRLKAILSPARWKFVFGHHPPYSSGTTYGSNATLQRNFSEMGIDIVFSAHEHNYEHLLIGGIHYVNCGLGGKSRYPFGSAISGSLTRYNALETRVRVTITDCDTCLVEAINSSGVLVDSFTISKT